MQHPTDHNPFSHIHSPKINFWVNIFLGYYKNVLIVILQLSHPSEHLNDINIVIGSHVKTFCTLNYFPQKELHYYNIVEVRTLPESEALPSVGFFAECLLSGTRQRKLCRVPHSVQLGTRQIVLCRELNTRHRTALGKDNFAECQTLGKGGSRQTAVSGRPKADGR
jgi:hypothetical protein